MKTTTALQFDAIDAIPNSDRPLLALDSAIERLDATAAKVERRFAENGWQGTWTYTVFDYWHFHVEGHEVLACVAGQASIGFGGNDARGGIAITMKPGDVVIVPAGVGHKRLEGTPNFQVTGAYPPGQNGRITRAGAMSVDDARHAVSRLSDPATHPLNGRPFRWTGDPIHRA